MYPAAIGGALLAKTALFVSSGEGRGRMPDPSLSNSDAELGRYTVKLSPQPHSPLVFGLRKRNASLRPCFTKSTSVPLM